jgi:hypothetical protein
MDVFVGIDVSKDRLDICVRPSEEAFTVARDHEGLERLVERLRAISPALVALDATGGYETIVAGALAAAHLPLAVVNPVRSASSPVRPESSPRPIASTPRPSLTLPRPSARPRSTSPTKKPRRWANWWRAGTRSSR